MEMAHLGISLCIGLGLSAACGFRIFIPPLLMGLAGHLGYMDLSDDFSWMQSLPAISVFATATIIEILAYYIPWVDNLLDTLAAPTAVIAGILVSAATLGDVPPIIQWTLALIAGGGSAGVVQAGTTALRVVSSATTGGLGNPVVSTAEATASTGLTIAAIFIPLLAAMAFLLVIYFAIRAIRRRKTHTDPGEQAISPSDRAISGR